MTTTEKERDAPPTAEALTLGGVLSGGFRLIGMFIRWHPWSFTLAVLGAGIFVAAIVASAIVIGRITDLVIIPVLDGGEEIGNKVAVAVLAIMVVAVIKAAGITLRRTAASALQYRTRADAREWLVDHQFRLGLSWHDQRSTGDLLSVSEVDTQLGTFVLAPLPYAIGASLLLVGTIAMVFATNWILGVIALVGLAILVLIDVFGAFSLFTQFEAAQRERGIVGEIAHESIDGALTVKALGRESEETERFRAASDVLKDRLVTIGVRFANFRAVVEAIPAAINVIIIVFGAFLVADGSMTTGQLVSIAYLITLMAFPLQLIGFVIFEMAHSQAAWKRVQDVLDADDLVEHGSLSATADRSGAPVDSDEVAFSYIDEEPVLTNLELDIPAGRTVAVVGPTGSGKSTVAMLLARLWDPSDGTIRIDGRDLRHFARSELPLEVAFVSQDTFLFDDTVWGNITLGVDIPEEDVLEAARLAGVERFVHELPAGYNTAIGERGTSLSGGERQRVALARALVRRPRVLLLDDATSAVDPSVETEILRGLKRAALPSTIVVVAYRRSSIMLTDEVVFVDDGRVIAHGTHEELLATVPGYERILRAYEEDAARREGEASAP
jgi:ABC-type multidrug transport system fused ATPase/permease subunit